MLQFKLRSDYQGTMKVIYDVIRELKGRLEYYSPSKGVVVFTKPWYSWYSNLSMIIDVQPLPGGCIIVLHAFFPGVPLRYNRLPRRYEKKLAERILGNET